ncbi:hypothetical protein FFONT_1261 [Fervidicoccus fontis Kam940]|jgi:hypothetical protein|uniref:Uncharacterized protein n=1 Tax=Fervidicoccus fontis (strain DSM 19380 / JCM 18336 / VKM B-2539 / Kam940) TaxID=1163730 RepID=I0A2P2_FERFK|nr:hypothetical protein FFONT_1261 [Fervidicoccus fontis Kam940]
MNIESFKLNKSSFSVENLTFQGGMKIIVFLALSFITDLLAFWGGEAFSCKESIIQLKGTLSREESKLFTKL